MAKSQKHGNSDVKKPKQIKSAPSVACEGVLAKAGMGATPASKKRA